MGWNLHLLLLQLPVFLLFSSTTTTTTSPPPLSCSHPSITCSHHVAARPITLCWQVCDSGRPWKCISAHTLSHTHTRARTAGLVCFLSLAPTKKLQFVTTSPTSRCAIPHRPATTHAAAGHQGHRLSVSQSVCLPVCLSIYCNYFSAES